MSHIFAHPVLAPWLSDYASSAHFGISVGPCVPTVTSAERLSIIVEYQLSCLTLELLVSDGHAAFSTLVTSPRTMFRELFVHSANYNDEIYLPLRMDDFAHDIILTPYVVATSGVVVPVTDEHDLEFSQAGRTEFELSTGAVLAIGDGIRLSNNEQTVTSIIDIVFSVSVPPGQFLLDYDDTRIKVRVNREAQAGLNTMRAGSPIARATLLPGLYLHAIVGGISRLSSHRDSAWAAVLCAALKNNGIDEGDQKHLTDNAQLYAQILLDSPLGQLLDIFKEAGNDD